MQGGKGFVDPPLVLGANLDRSLVQVTSHGGRRQCDCRRLLDPIDTIKAGADQLAYGTKRWCVVGDLLTRSGEALDSAVEKRYLPPQAFKG